MDCKIKELLLLLAKLKYIIKATKAKSILSEISCGERLFCCKMTFALAKKYWYVCG